MKKFLTVLVLLVLLITVTAFALPAMAEGTDYKAMSADELIALRTSINDELRARLASDASVVYNGSFIVGVDIKPGAYLFTCVTVDEGKERMGIGTEGKEKDYNDIYLRVGDSTIINLSADDIKLGIIDGSCTIQLTVKPDWAP